MKRMMVALLSMGLAFTLAGCSGGDSAASSAAGGDASAESSENKGPAKDEIKVDDIVWSVDNSVIDGNRRVVLQYENKSAYTIADLRIEFKIKEGLSEEELAEAFSGMQTEYDPDPVGDAKEYGMWGESYIPVAPGETSTAAPLEVGITYINDMAQFEAVEPDLMTIAFLSDDGSKLYKETYDFKNDSYSLDSKVVDTTEWGSEEPATMSPSPDGMIVVDVEDTADRFSFEAIDVDESEFDAYVDACKEMGFTVEPIETDGVYYASHVDGSFGIDCFYYPSMQHFSIFLDRIG